MEKIDRRAQRSQQLLGDALIALILERGYDAITVRDITDRADVAHATFYRHYRDKDEMLMRLLEAVVEELDGLTNDPALQDAEGYLIFKHADENAALYRILLSSPGAARVRKYIQAKIVKSVLKNCPMLGLNPLIPADAAANHIAASMLALMEWWLENDRPVPVYQIGQTYNALIVQPTLLAVENPALLQGVGYSTSR